MSVQRYISTSFWDDRWIRTLDPSERYLYLYLMTNPLTNIAGVYQITIDRIAFDTGYDERTLQPMIQRFTDARKAIFYHDEWMILPSWPKHQRIKARDNVRKGVDALLLALPQDVYEMLFEVGYRYQFLEELKDAKPLASPFKPLGSPSNYSDSDTDSDTDSDAKGKTLHEKHRVPIGTTRYRSLCEQYGQGVVDNAIQERIDWEAAKGKPKAKDYAAAAANWLKRAEADGRVKFVPKKPGDYA